MFKVKIWFMIKKTNLLKQYGRKIIGILSPKLLASIDCYRNMGYWLDLENPKDINEKVIWLSFNSDLTEWTRLADKYAVRDYIKEKGYESLLVELYGVYERAEDIDYSKLPPRFIIKTNHGSGTNVIVNDKQKLDIEQTNRTLNKWLKLKCGWPVERHYMAIKPLIIIEELLDISKQQMATNCLIDYKVFCCDGEPVSILTCSNRTDKSVDLTIYYPDWSYHPEKCIFSKRFTKGDYLIPRPKNLDLMMKASRDLSRNFPQVRVDWYEVDGKLYFGEMTFTSSSGVIEYFTREHLLELGSRITLPKHSMV